MQKQAAEQMRRGVGLALAAGLALWWGRAGLIPAAIRNGRLETLSGSQPAYGFVRWDFGSGLRPLSVIFDLTLDNQTAGSITTDGEATEAEIPLIGAIAPGSYILVAAATYRVLGVVYTREFRFSGSNPADSAGA